MIEWKVDLASALITDGTYGRWATSRWNILEAKVLVQIGTKNLDVCSVYRWRTSNLRMLLPVPLTAARSDNIHASSTAQVLLLI